jgi:hypothetical protein
LFTVLLILAPGLAACSHDPQETARGPVAGSTTGGTPSATATPAAEPAPLRVEIGRLVGHLPGPRRTTLRNQIGRVVDGWWDAAYLGGDYPRTTFPAAFPGFTGGAEDRARQDKALITNADIGERLDAVLATRRRVLLDVLATRGYPRSVTARFELRFRATGAKARLVTVAGRLFLIHGPGGWKVFGYDVTKGAR